MKTVKVKETKEINWAIPGQTVTHDDFMNSIKEAEKGPFYTVQESMQHFEQWLKSRKKQ
jgi:hypothetical protein